VKAPFARPHFTTGIELDGPYRRTPTEHAQHVRQALANTLARVQATVQKLSTKQGSRT
jgi:hypothetical protein